MRIKLTVAYDGTDFRGWAVQKGQRTVRSTLTEAVRQISGEENEIFGASRTDSGAHAKGQVCHFDTNVAIPPHKWAEVVNNWLPIDLCILRSSRANDDFNSRFSAIDRRYRYRILVGRRDPHRERNCHFHIGKSLDLDKMRRAAAILQGSHDFLAFTEEIDGSVTNTNRNLFRFEVRQIRDEVWVDVVGTAFLRGMMRRMAGAVLEVGRGRRPVEEVSRLLDKEERTKLTWPVVLPAKGLCLMAVRYGRHPRDHRDQLRDDLKQITDRDDDNE